MGNRLGGWLLMCSMAHAFLIVKFEMAGDTLTLALSRERERGWMNNSRRDGRSLQSLLWTWHNAGRNLTPVVGATRR